MLQCRGGNFSAMPRLSCMHTSTCMSGECFECHAWSAWVLTKQEKDAVVIEGDGCVQRVTCQNRLAIPALHVRLNGVVYMRHHIRSPVGALEVRG